MHPGLTGVFAHVSNYDLSKSSVARLPSSPIQEAFIKVRDDFEGIVERNNPFPCALLATPLFMQPRTFVGLQTHAACSCEVFHLLGPLSPSWKQSS